MFLGVDEFAKDDGEDHEVEQIEIEVNDAANVLFIHLLYLHPFLSTHIVPPKHHHILKAALHDVAVRLHLLHRPSQLPDYPNQRTYLIQI